MDNYGLIGRNIDYSFSKEFFTKKFSLEGISATYHNFDLQEMAAFKTLLKTEKDLKGLNVTIPYKEKIIPFLDAMDPIAAKIGAVNTIKFFDQKLIGYNTDAHGFLKSISPLLQKQHKKALILGTGGASKAVVFALKSLGIEPLFVSRKSKENSYSYAQLSEEIIKTHLLIVNCTPLGTSPRTDECPDIPYKFLSSQHLLFDLIYNPPRTQFMINGEHRGATTCNGQKMLEFQAEKAWEVWNSK